MRGRGRTGTLISWDLTHWWHHLTCMDPNPSRNLEAEGAAWFPVPLKLCTIRQTPNSTQSEVGFHLRLKPTPLLIHKMGMVPGSLIPYLNRQHISETSKHFLEPVCQGPEGGKFYMLR